MRDREHSPDGAAGSRVCLDAVVLPDPSSRSSHPLARVSWPLPDVWGGPDRPHPGASGAAGGVDARRWRILSSNPAVSAASTPPPSATIQTFEPSLAGVAALGDSKTSGASAPPGSLASSPTLGSVLAGRGASPAVSFAYDLGHPLLAIPGDARRFVVQPVSTSGLASQLSPSPR
jgi:hypothetical protein